MAKRGNAGIGTVSTEEQWKNCISKPGLSLFDIYSECWGPCLAIQPTFRQLQMEFGDGLSIMLAETDNIEELNKFRGTSQPLFLLYCKGVPIAYMKGANQPKLLDLVRRCSKDQKENKKIVNIFEDPTPEEEALARSMSLASNSQKSATELSDFTLALIKPDAVRAGFVEDIINELNENGLMVISQQEHTMTAEEVQKFYLHISTEPYFLNLVDYMTSGPSVALVLAKVNPSERPVCEILKELRGPKDLACAKQEKPASLRAKFGVQSESGVENAFHSSDTSDTAVNELAFFFPNFKNETAGLERTLCIIRPDTNKQYKETILARLTELGFSIALQREFVMTRTMAETFYRKHREEPFFEQLVSQMISGPSLVLALCSRDAVRQWRSVLGPTLVPEAKETAPESMRATFTTDDVMNGLHGSSTAEEAADELNFFFPAEQTVACIKPEMMDKKEEIMKRIEEAGIVIQAQKTVTLSQNEAGSFYDEHKNKEFYGDLCSYMASGESTFLVLSANNAVEKWREIIGPADPNEAKATKPQSLRSKLGKDILKNGLHGSSSAEHALKSIEQIFGASMTIRSSKSKSFMNSSQGLDTSDGIAEIGSVQGVTDKTENDVCSDLPTDSPKDNNKSSSQRTLEDGQDLPELPHDSENHTPRVTPELTVTPEADLTANETITNEIVKRTQSQAQWHLSKSPTRSGMSVMGAQSQMALTRTQMSVTLAQSHLDLAQSRIEAAETQIEETRAQSASGTPTTESIQKIAAARSQINQAQSDIDQSKSLIEKVQSQSDIDQSKSLIEKVQSQMLEEAQSKIEAAQSLIEQALSHIGESSSLEQAQSPNEESQPQNEESQPPNEESQPQNEESQPQNEESQPQNEESRLPAEESQPPNEESQNDTTDAEKSDPNDNKATEETGQTETENTEKQAEPSLGENPVEKEKQEEETAVKEEVVKPPAVESEEVHNGEVETVDALQPSMTNMSEGLSPISEGQEDYFQDSFNSDSSVLREARETLENEVTMTNTPDHTGDELEELPADSDKEGTTPVPEKKED